MDRSIPTPTSDSWLSRTFAATSSGKKQSKYPPPFSLRLTFEQRTRLEREAGTMGVGAYIRSRLFGEAEGTGKRTRTRYPVKDEQALARVLGELGQSRIANNLNQLAKAANMGSLEVTPETEAELQDACAAIQAIRRDLIAALGLGGGS